MRATAWGKGGTCVTLHKQIFTRSSCYKAGKKMTPRGVMLHSTGANNPNLRRYISPDDGRLGSPSGNHWNRPGLDVCVHAFIGKLADGSVAVYQTLPWSYRGWHCGGRGNRTHIAFEICEDGLEDPQYFAAVYRVAVELTTMLCREFDLDPLADGVVICHAEGYRRGIASNHADVLHWFSRHGKSMDDFRTDVVRELEGGEVVTQEQFDAMMENWLKRQNEKEPTEPWMIQGVERAKAAGVTDGSRPMAFCTRLEAAMMAAK